MNTSIIKVIAFLLLVLPLSTTNSWAYDVDSIQLRQIELPKDSPIFKIIKKAMSEVQYKKDLNFFTLDIKDGPEMDEVEIFIVAHPKKELFNWNGYSGYLCVGSIPFIITNESKLKLSFSDTQTKYFPMDLPNTPPYVYDPEVWEFRLKNEDISRYVPAIGWIWDSHIPDGGNHSNSSFRLTRPRRTSKY